MLENWNCLYLGSFPDTVPADEADNAQSAVGYANVMHYVDWQSQPETRIKRYLYVTAREFPQWADTIARRAYAGRGIMNVGQWRELHPIQDKGNP